MIRKPPSTASIASQGAGARLHAPSAERNADVLCAFLARAKPSPGKALELASGTGQHVVQFAQAFPALHWHPTEPDAERRASIDAWVATSQCKNISPAQDLDACRTGWSRDWNGQDLIVLVNLLHLISDVEAQTLVSEAARALAPSGAFVLYGPFMRNGVLTSDGDARFHASLREQDPDIGYKSDTDILDWFAANGLGEVETEALPANNLGFIARRAPL